MNFIAKIKQMDNGLKKVIILFLIWLFILTSIGYIAKVYEVNNPENKINTKKILVDNWCNWDGGFFQSIAKHGYHRKPGDSDFGFEQEVRTAFFPLYPFLMRHIGAYVGGFDTASRIISILSTFILTIIFYKLLRLDEDEKTSIKTILYLLLFPAAFFLIAGYSESLFFMLMIGSFYAARRSKWFLAGILGALATSTRFVGILIFPALVYEYLSQINFDFKKIKHQIAYLLFIPFGIGVYMWYLNKSFGDPMLFIKIENSWDKKMTLNIFTTLKKNFTFNKENPFSLLFIQHLYEYIIAILFTIFTFKCFSKIRTSYFIYTAIYMLMILLMGNFGSFNRFVLVLFPIFIYLSKTIKNEFYHQLYIYFSTAFLVIFTAFFTLGKWSG